MSDQDAGEQTTVVASNDLHIKHVSRIVNEELGGEATVEDIVRLMLEIGWKPPVVAIRIRGSNG